MMQESLRHEYENIYSQALDIVEHWDAMPALNIYRELEEFLNKLPTEQKQNQDLISEISILKRNLLAVAFPTLPKEEAKKFFREHLLDFFRIDVDFQERLMTRYTFVGYGEKEDERIQLKEAILQNEEQLGLLTVGQWIRLFDERFRTERRNADSVQSFLTQTREVAALEKSEQNVLRQILSVYEEFLAKPVLDDFDLAVLSTRSAKQSGSMNYYKQRANDSSDVSGEKVNIVSLPLLQALSKYNQLGQQTITSEKIKLKTQIEPVRPSLVNWLKYYRDELGIGQHSSVERGEFLFRSENGRKLSPEERERISLILKSVEEYLPITIDTERQEIIFPAFTSLEPVRAKAGLAEASAGRPPFQGVTMNAGRQPNAVSNSPATANVSGSPAFHPVAPNSQEFGRQSPPTPARSNVGNVSFSSGHTLPAEKESSQPARRPVPPSQPSSFRIRPMGRE